MNIIFVEHESNDTEIKSLDTMQLIKTPKILKNNKEN